MTDYPQFPPPPQQPPRPPHQGAPYPGVQHPQPSYTGQPSNLYPGHPYPPPPTPEPPTTPKNNSLRLKIGLAIGGVVALVAVVAGIALGAGNDTEATATESTPGLGAEPSEVEIDTGQAARNEIIRDSASFQYLSAPDWIMPGAKYIVAKADGQISFCSFGWMVRQPSAPQQLYNLTAGHCGDPGDGVYLDPNGNEDPNDFINIGQFIGQDYAGEHDIRTGADYGLIQIDPGWNEYVRYTPDISVVTGEGLDLVGAVSPQALADFKPYTCHLGFRSGLSCGPFREVTSGTNLVFESISDKGDSGGVVWSFEDPVNSGIIYASGIVSWVEFYGDATATNAKTIDEVLAVNGLQLVKE